MNFSTGGAPASTVSASASFTVDELISVRVTPPVAATTVASPDGDRVLSFLITNTGNGTESFSLGVNYALGGDQFDPSPGSSGTLFLDVNNDGAFQSGIDTLITGSVTLARDQTVRILLLANIPGSRTDGDLGRVSLTAASTTPGAAPAGTGASPGTVLAGQGTGGVDAVVGAGPGGGADSGADDTATGSYVVSGAAVAMQKVLLSVSDPFGNPCIVTGGNSSPCLVPGATVEYRVTVTVTSLSGAAVQNLQVTDSISANTTYVPNSIRLNTIAKTDAIDADEASCTGCGNATGAVAVSLGNVTGTAGGTVNQVDFKVTIN